MPRMGSRAIGRTPARPRPAGPPRPDGGPPPPVGARPLAQRFRDAFRGIGDAYREEPNLRFHAFAACGVAVTAAAVGVTPAHGLYLLGTVTLVLVAELVNTAVERAVDLGAGGRAHPLARQAKDAAAGAVLLAVLHAAAAGWVIFIQPRGVFGFLAALTSWPDRAPAQAAAGAAVLLAAGLAGIVVNRKRRGHS